MVSGRDCVVVVQCSSSFYSCRPSGVHIHTRARLSYCVLLFQTSFNDQAYSFDRQLQGHYTIFSLANFPVKDPKFQLRAGGGELILRG